MLLDGCFVLVLFCEVCERFNAIHYVVFYVYMTVSLVGFVKHCCLVVFLTDVSVSGEVNLPALFSWGLFRIYQWLLFLSRPL